MYKTRSQSVEMTKNTLSEIEKLDEISFKRKLTKRELERVWQIATASETNCRFRAINILSDYISNKNSDRYKQNAINESHWWPRSAWYIALTNFDSRSVISFLESQFEGERNPNAKYVLGIGMREIKNIKVLKICSSIDSKQPRWILAKLEAKYILGEISEDFYKKKLIAMAEVQKNWRFIERYLKNAEVEFPPGMINRGFH